MIATSIALISLAVFIWGLFSARLGRADLSAPIVFVVVGLLLSTWTQGTEPEAAREAIKVLAEVTLVWVLFSDAAGVAFGQVRHDLGRIVRLLGIGLPLTVVAGWAWRSGCSRARASGSPCWWPPPSLPPTPLSGCRSS